MLASLTVAPPQSAARPMRGGGAAACGRAAARAGVRCRVAAPERPSVAVGLPFEIKKPIWDLPLEDVDPEVYKIIRDEKIRQCKGINLTASENCTSTAVMEVSGSCMTNKYSEGRPLARYYGGNENIDKAELLCEKRAKELFKLDPSEWGVNVQPHSGSPANLAVYVALLNPGDRMMGLKLTHGGHLTHGFYTEKKKVSATSQFYESSQYSLDESTGLIDYEALHKAAKEFCPKMIIAGASAYSRNIDYARMRAICDDVGAYLMADMAHISGLVATGVVPGPFEHCDVVTTTTHKSLRGPRGGMIFYRQQFKDQVNNAVFPSLQGGPHNQAIAALAVALKQANTPIFVEYQKQVVANCTALCARLQALGYTIISGGTDNHLILVDLKPQGVNGAWVERILDEVNITLNKNSVPGDKSAMTPGGIRIGTPALTTRGFKEADFVKVGDFLHRVVEITKGLRSKLGPDAKLKDLVALLGTDGATRGQLQAFRQEVEDFCTPFPMPGN